MAINYYNRVFDKGYVMPKRLMYSRAKNDTTIVLYLYMINNDTITNDILNKIGVRDIDRKVKLINNGGNFFLEYVGDGKYYIIK